MSKAARNLISSKESGRDSTQIFSRESDVWWKGSALFVNTTLCIGKKKNKKII
jgi:hypothetical protein